LEPVEPQEEFAEPQ
jgi:hypothetical protein